MRKNIIDGLPTSYDHNYVLKTNKRCFFCQKRILQSDIENNLVACTEDFDFIHKDCVEKNGYEIIHNNPKDLSSMLKIKKISNQNLDSSDTKINNNSNNKVSFWL